MPLLLLLLLRLLQLLVHFPDAEIKIPFSIIFFYAELKVTLLSCKPRSLEAIEELATRLLDASYFANISTAEMIS